MFLLPSVNFSEILALVPIARTKTSKNFFTKCLIQVILFISATLLILSTTVLVLNTSSVGIRPSPQVLAAPVQISTSDRDQVYRDIVRLFLRDLDDRPHAQVVLTPPVPPPT